jgi:hypothetical protein
MIIALFGGDGRAVGTYAAVLVARAAASVGTATTLLRVVGALESRLPRPDSVPDPLRVVELCSDDPSFATDLREETSAVPEKHLVVLDLPPGWTAACPVEVGNCPRIVAVGPSVLEGTIAVSALRETGGVPGPWLLACGASSIRSFDRNIREIAFAQGIDDTVVRVVAHGLPDPRRDYAAATPGGRLAPLSRSAALRVLGAILPGAVEMLRPPAEVRAPTLAGMGEADRRDPQERLRDLADALDAAEGDDYPSAEELAAPLLEDWEFGMRSVAALVGRVTQHPDFPAGRRVRTSEVYVSDRRTWARTYSRLYRLGRPAGPRPSLQ